MISYISKAMLPIFNGVLLKFLCCLALIFTTSMLQSCDKSNGSLELTVKASGLTVSNFPVTLKTGSNTYTVSSNLDGVALFSDLSGGDYTASWSSTTLTFPNGARVVVNAGSKTFFLSQGEAKVGTLTIN